MAAPELTTGEQRTGLFLGAAAFVAFVVLSGGNPLFLAIGLTMAVGLLLASARRNRIATAAISFVTAFGPWVFAAIFGVFYAAFGLWLLARASRRGVTPPGPSGGSGGAPPGRGRAV